MYLIEAFVTNASLNINKPFTYYFDHDIEKYCRIEVLFRNSLNVALVVNSSYSDRSVEELNEEKGYRLQKVLRVIDDKPVISDELYDLALWMSKTTISPLVSCLNAMLPKTYKTTRNIRNIRYISKVRKNNGDFRLTDRQREVYDQIIDGMKYTDALKLSSSIPKKLIELGAIEKYDEELSYVNETIDKTAFKELTTDQKKAYEGLINTDKLVSLLFGVTGSGKTEVYLHLARHYLSKDKDVLILVPEISLTPQMIERVKQRFDDVVFYHSELSDQERYEQYKRIKNREVRIVVGTRSSIFLPFNDLGLIIIDEEHDSSYKQDSTPCYHVRNVAIKRAHDHGGKVLLASATPSLDSYTRALKGDYQLLELKQRINLTLPEIKIIDLNRSLRKYQSYIISEQLKEEIDNTLNNDKQAIILLNRRGYSPIVKCSNCSATLMCQDCDSPLNYHKDINLLKCHQCGRTYELPKRCPNCHEDTLIFYGFGTKRVEEELNRYFPSARIARMDRDSVGRKGAHGKILKQFEERQIDILIGTQMIAKGLDYPDVTLVGILNADAGLMHQDYNSAKMTFDLLMQASGRSGRANEKGKVLIQAFNTEHYALKAVLNQDYNYFYNIEMNYRNKTKYPPYSHIVEIILSDTSEDRLDRSVEYMSKLLEPLKYRKYRPYVLSRIQKLYRTRILIMDKDLIGIINDLQGIIETYSSTSSLSHVKIDVDPLYLE
ncbi:MAG: primosomal protein N' [Erysipelotrichaceae bacterium]|nr:primosomal protein N' [Erysipelotrichaceae bacterium]